MLVELKLDATFIELLNKKEIEILLLIGEGKSNKTIADLHGMQVRTLQQYVVSIGRKIILNEDLDSRRVLALIGYRYKEEFKKYLTNISSTSTQPTLLVKTAEWVKIFS